MARRFEFEDYKGPALAVLLLLLEFAVHGCVHQAIADTPGTLYRLGSDSDHEVGCFDPCACPVLIHSPMTGTFRMELTGISEAQQNYQVTEIDWEVLTQ